MSCVYVAVVAVFADNLLVSIVGSFLPSFVVEPDFILDMYFCNAKSNAAGFTTTTSKSSSSSLPGK